jgi:integrase/recombinase XerD
LDLPRGKIRLPKCVLTASEAEQVINQPNVNEKLGIRDRAILETFYSTGIRRRELVNLRPVDLDLERGTVVIWQGKGHKDRVIPIGDRATAWIERYEVEVRPGLLIGDSAADVLFLTHLGKPFDPNQMTSLVGDYVKAAEIGKQGACHLLRHSMATLMHENGAGIRYIQEMLGHASLETTQIYTRVSIRKLKEVHTNTHPARNERSPGRPVTPKPPSPDGPQESQGGSPGSP